MDQETYRNYLKKRGRNLAEVKKNQSDVIMDRTFKVDPNYKRVYILTRDGWKWEDIKFNQHTAPSILKDAVDWYVQFRPKVHYPIGSYMIIPDDTDFSLNLTDDELKDPFTQPVENRTQWWFIVGRDDATQFVNYSVLKCNYEFKWIYKNQIMRCFGSVRNANSYTSGRWRNEKGIYLDNLDSAWIPDILYTYGNNYQSLGLNDNHTLTYDVRLMVTNNNYEPKVYQISKVSEMTPQGVIKLTFKQDDFNKNRDSIKYGVCDYYDNEGHKNIEIIPVKEPTLFTSVISWMTVNDEGELIPGIEDQLQRGKIQYFSVDFYNDGEEVIVEPEWKISGQDEYSIGLMKITKFDNKVIGVRPAKASSLSGKTFTLSVNDIEGNYYSSIDLEVI